jgi:hypothetical protein
LRRTYIPLPTRNRSPVVGLTETSLKCVTFSHTSSSRHSPHRIVVKQTDTVFLPPSRTVRPTIPVDSTGNKIGPYLFTHRAFLVMLRFSCSAGRYATGTLELKRHMFPRLYQTRLQVPVYALCCGKNVASAFLFCCLHCDLSPPTSPQIYYVHDEDTNNHKLIVIQPNGKLTRIFLITTYSDSTKFLTLTTSFHIVAPLKYYI